MVSTLEAEYAVDADFRRREAPDLFETMATAAMESS
jgi:hypothetical protein